MINAMYSHIVIQYALDSVWSQSQIHAVQNINLLHVVTDKIHTFSIFCGMSGIVFETCVNHSLLIAWDAGIIRSGCCRCNWAEWKHEIVDHARPGGRQVMFRSEIMHADCRSTGSITWTCCKNAFLSRLCISAHLHCHINSWIAASAFFTSCHKPVWHAKRCCIDLIFGMMINQ